MCNNKSIEMGDNIFLSCYVAHWLWSNTTTLHICGQRAALQEQTEVKDAITNSFLPRRVAHNDHWCLCRGLVEMLTDMVIQQCNVSEIQNIHNFDDFPFLLVLNFIKLNVAVDLLHSDETAATEAAASLKGRGIGIRFYKDLRAHFCHCKCHIVFA